MNLINFTVDVNTSSATPLLPPVATALIVAFSVAFFLVGFVGILGNALVIYVIVADKKMRQSLTNMLIINLAISDLLIMLFGIPEIVQFMLNKGWVLSDVLCPVQRSVLVVALYVSVMTLVALCIERYIAIIFPIKAHLLCTRKQTLLIVVCIWITSGLCGIPTMMYDQVTFSGHFGSGIRFCQLIMPGDSQYHFLIYKYIEAALFYFIPLVIQIICYSIIGRVLFVGAEELHSSPSCRQNGDHKRTSEALARRRGVVKMLIASVLIYFLSYSPHQVLLIYNTFSPSAFHQTWVYLVFVTVLAYANSAANPILYCIFSENFRQQFSNLLSCQSCKTSYSNEMALRSTVVSHNSEYTVLVRRTPQTKNHYGLSDV